MLISYAYIENVSCQIVVSAVNIIAPFKTYLLFISGHREMKLSTLAFFSPQDKVFSTVSVSADMKCLAIVLY